jgi:hypothetical protein
MSTTQADRIVDDYLQRLEVAAARLQRSRRAELVAEIREHIEAALRQEDTANEAAVRNVLERLGPPEEIVEAAEPARAPSATRVGTLEITALLALLVPVIGWLVGIVLVLVSEAWSNRDKLIGVGLALLPVLVPLFLIIVGAESGDEELVPVGDDRPVGREETGSGSGLGGVEVLILGMLAGLPSALYLGWRLRRRPAS